MKKEHEKLCCSCKIKESGDNGLNCLLDVDNFYRILKMKYEGGLVLDSMLTHVLNECYKNKKTIDEFKEHCDHLWYALELSHKKKDDK